MKFKPEISALPAGILEPDYAKAQNMGKVHLGEQCLYFRKLSGTSYLPYGQIVRAWLRQEEVRARMLRHRQPRPVLSGNGLRRRPGAPGSGDRQGDGPALSGPYRSQKPGRQNRSGVCFYVAIRQLKDSSLSKSLAGSEAF